MPFHYNYMKPYVVYRCPECGDLQYEDKIPSGYVRTIFEDLDKSDTVIYECPECHKVVESKRYTYRGGR